MNLAIELLRLIGSPYSSSSLRNASVGVDPKFLQYSLKNRLSLLYLDAIRQAEGFDIFQEVYDQHIAKYSETFDAVARISRTLTTADIDHAVFKTLRPYISTTVDIDVIIFGSTLDYEKAIKETELADYEKLARGPMSTTFRDPIMKIGVDLYDEVAVSYVTYIDKTKLEDYVIDTELPSGEQVKTLACEADLIAIIAHSIIKENMYTLSEYYTYVYYLEKLNVDYFVKLAKETHLESPTRTHTAITAMLYELAYGTLPLKLKQILDKTGMEKLELAQVIRNDLRMPHKYHPVTIARCLLEVSQERKTRKGIANQILHSFNASFSRDFFKKLNLHIARETY